MKRRSICLAACLLLAACAGGARNNTPAEVYDFGLPAARLAEGSGWSKLALEIRAAYWFDSPSIEYRLLYDDPLKLRSYAASRWAGAPGLLLAQHLRQQLGLLDSSGRTAVSCLLRLELQEFSQVFETPLLSRGVLQGTARTRRQAPDRRRTCVQHRAAGSRRRCQWRRARPGCGQQRPRAATRRLVAGTRETWPAEAVPGDDR
jgi:cholesterol transport system auxiliary component